MNATALRNQGYRVVFHYGKVYKIHLKSQTIEQQNIDSGRWMERPDGFIMVLFCGLSMHAQKHIQSALENCYCNSLSGSTCDFCGGARR